MRADLFWIPGPWRGLLAIGARPRGGDWLDDETRAWRRAGVDIVVSLLEDDEAAQLDLADERRSVKASASFHFRFLIEVCRHPPNRRSQRSDVSQHSSTPEEMSPCIAARASVDPA